MPIYEYRCPACGHPEEHYHKREPISPLACESCGAKLEQVPSVPAKPVVCGPLGPGWRITTTQERITGSELEYSLKHAPSDAE